MLKYDLPQHDTNYSVWLELQTYNELPDECRGVAWTLSQVIAERNGIDVMSANTQQKLYTVTYPELLKVFPDLAPEEVYPIVCYE